MPSVASYTHFGGRHAETASLTNLLRAQGVVAPHDGRPYSEAMLLGVGGGLGAGYILWEFREHQAKVLVFGWRNRWQYPIKWYDMVCRRIDADPTFHETEARRVPGAPQLDVALDAGHPVVAGLTAPRCPTSSPKAPELGIDVLLRRVPGGRGDHDGAFVDDLAAGDCSASRWPRSPPPAAAIG